MHRYEIQHLFSTEKKIKGLGWEKSQTLYCEGHIRCPKKSTKGPKVQHLWRTGASAQQVLDWQTQSAALKAEGTQSKIGKRLLSAAHGRSWLMAKGKLQKLHEPKGGCIGGKGQTRQSLI